MRQRRIRPRQAPAVAQRFVHAAQLQVLFPAVGDVAGGVGAEEVLVADADQQGLGSERVEEVPAVEAGGAAVEKILLRVVGRARRVEIGASQVLGVAARNGRRGQPVVNRHQQHGQRAAARLSRGSKPLGINQRVRGKIIETPHGIPHLKARAGVAVEQHLLAGQSVLIVGRREARALQLRVGVIDALALAHRVEGQHQVAQTRQALAAALVTLRRLAVQRVAHLEQHARVGWFAAGGDIKVGGDVQPRPAFVDHLLHTVARPLEATEDARVERRPFGHAARELPERLAHPRLPPGDGGRRSERGERPIAARIGCAGEVAEVVRQAARIVAVGRAREAGLRKGREGGQRKTARERQQRSARHGYHYSPNRVNHPAS